MAEPANTLGLADENADPLRKYSTVATLLARYGGVQNDYIRREACRAFGEERQRQRYRVIGPEALTGIKAAFVGAQNQRLDWYTYNVVLKGDDGRLTVAELHSPQVLADRDQFADALNRSEITGDPLPPRERDHASRDDATPPSAPHSGFYLCTGGQRAFPFTAYSRRVSFAPIVSQFLADVKKAAREAEADVAATPSGLPELDRLRFVRPFNALQENFEVRRFNRAFNRFAQHLDPEALRLCRSVAMPDSETYNFMVGSTARCRMYRQQAVRAYPLFAKTLQKNTARACVDAGHPPPAAIARELAGLRDARDEDLYQDEDFDDAFADVAEAANPDKQRKAEEYDRIIRRLHGVTWQRVGREAFRNPASILEQLERIPPDWQPTGQKSYAAFRAVHDGARDIANSLPHRTVEGLLHSTGGRWRDLAGLLEQEPANGVSDMMRQAYNQFVLTAWHRALKARGITDRAPQEPEGVTLETNETGNPTEILARYFVSTKGLKKILEMNARYHRALTRIEAAAGQGRSDLHWLPLSEPMTFGKYRLIPLTSQRALTNEGNAMNHCVGGYADKCLHNGHIISIRRADDDARIATGEISEQPVNRKKRKQRAKAGKSEPDPLMASQLCGRANRTVPADVKRAFDRYIAYLNKPENRPDFEQIQAQRQHVRTTMKAMRLQSQVGFNPEDREINERVWQEWRRFVPGPARKAETLDDLYEITGLGAYVDAMADKVKADVDAQDRKARIAQQMDALATTQAETPVEPPTWAIEEGTLTFAEWRWLENNRPELMHEDVQSALPGHGFMLDDVEPDWDRLPQTRAEAERRGDIMREAVLDGAYRRVTRSRFNTFGNRNGIANKVRTGKRAVVATSRIEAQAYKAALTEAVHRYARFPINQDDDQHRMGAFGQVA